MRTKQADGSITEECLKCGGSTFICNVDTDLSERCENCKGAGVIEIAPSDHVVTDESLVVVAPAVSFGGGSPAPITLRAGDEVLLHQGPDDPGKPVTVTDINESTNTITISSPIVPGTVDSISFTRKPSEVAQ